ncbi:MAG: efflux RND transporter periplasmic adaptor subunit [Deferribacterales bacterium]
MFRKLIVTTAMLAMLTACGGKEKSDEAMNAPATVKVKTYTVALTDADSSRSFTATISSDKTAIIIPKVTGYVEQINVTPGQHVKKGELLAVIKSGELEQKMAFADSSEQEAQNGLRQAEIGYKMAVAQQNQAKSQYELAEKTYNRYSNLIKNNSVSKQEFDQVEAQYNLAKQQYNISQENVDLSQQKVEQVKIKAKQAAAMRSEVNTYLSYTQLRAPFDGVVLEKNMDAGNLAAPGSPILKVGNNVPVVYAYVSQSMLNEINVGTKARVSVDTMGESFESEVIELSPDIDPATGNFKVKLSGCEKLAQGMFAKVRFITGTEKIIAVPTQAVVQRGQLTMVFVDNGGKAEMRVIKPGRDLGGVTEILSGLSAGDKVVTENAQVLKSGDILEEK